MLYVTTRSKRDPFTPQRMLSQKRDAGGGLYIPFHDPHFSCNEMDALAKKSFSACVAELLNLQFNTKLTAWDVDFAVGRYPVRLKQLNQRIVMGELWHNTQWVFSGLAGHLAEQISGDSNGGCLADWVPIGVRIAVLFGIYGELNRAGIAGPEQPFDVSVVSGDFSGAMSVWYARKWGLPVANLVCCCNENSDVWNLLVHGQLRTDGIVKNTVLPDADVAVPESLERMICAVGGVNAVNGYVHCMQRGQTYYADDGLLQQLRQGTHIAVVGQPRILETIPKVYATSKYVLSAYDALAYAGLLDFRSRTGSTRYALILSEKSPLCDASVVADALHTTQEELKLYFQKN